MPANTDPIFVGTLQTGWGRSAAANTNKDGTGTLIALLTGATNGTGIYAISCKAEGNTAAGTLRFFVGTGGNKRFWRELLVSAVTSSGSALSWYDYTLTSPDGAPLLVLKSGETLEFCMNAADPVVVGVTFGGDM